MQAITYTDIIRIREYLRKVCPVGHAEQEELAHLVDRLDAVINKNPREGKHHVTQRSAGTRPAAA